MRLVDDLMMGQVNAVSLLRAVMALDRYGPALAANLLCIDSPACCAAELSADLRAGFAASPERSIAGATAL